MSKFRANDRVRLTRKGEQSNPHLRKPWYTILALDLDGYAQLLINDVGGYWWVALDDIELDIPEYE